VVSTQLIDRIATRLDRRLYEVPVGFKWFSQGLLDASLGFCGEESAGAAFLRRDGRVWTTDKDGMIAALLAAVTYNLATWVLGYPSSSSNSLAGGLVGAGLYAVGMDSINWGVASLSSMRLDGVTKVVAGLLLSPLIGFVFGFAVMRLLRRAGRRLTIRARNLFSASQYLSVAWLGFSHGANDAQKGMAIIGMMLLATGASDEFVVPDWAIVLCASAITLGTLFGGWRIIRTLGFGLYRIRMLHAVANQFGAAAVNSFATLLGAPTSTTQVVTATLLGNGAAEKPGHVRWRTAAGIVTGWWLNLPISMMIGAIYAFCLLGIWRN